jgi:asparagine synthase (glutamine-hydrolysing)
MCGIGGVAQVDGGPLGPEADAVLDRLADSLSHRGPDDRKLLRDGPVGFAFTRLSLVDPAGGAQPLVSEDGDLVLIANGEVYNHKELAARLGVRPRTGSDCEILLYLYAKEGLDFLDQVHGMFALVLWDRLNGRLVFARDRFGIKPLYFHRDPHRVVFGSEIKSLFADPATPRRLDWAAALANPILSAAPYFGDDRQATWFEGVETVPAATILRIDLAGGGTETHRYWDFPGGPVDLPARDEDLVERYRDLLAASVADCATADTEIGLFLSGGVDSGAVAALAARHTATLHTFTALNAGTYANGDAAHARRVADLVGIPNHQVVFDAERVPSPAEWKRLLWLSETPMCNPEVFYKHELHRYAKAVRPELRGMLLGAAADEFGGGYTGLYAMGGGFAEFDGNLRGMARTGALRRRPDLTRWTNAGLVNDTAVRDLTGIDLADAYPLYLQWEYEKVQQYNLWHEDRTAAGSGIEARVPFLDHRLVELLAAIPPERREALLWDKRLIRAAARGLLPDDIVDRPKVPFFHGGGDRIVYRTFATMLQRDGAALVEEALAGPGGDLLDRAGVHRSLAEAAEDPTTERVEMLLRLVNLGLLAGMLADLPAPLVGTPAGPAPRAVPLTDTVAAGLGLRPPVAADAVVRLRPGVLLLNGGSTWYLAVDGSLEFEPEDEWLRVLQGVDGVRTAGEVVAGTAEGTSIIEQLVDMRLVEVA